MSLKISRRDFLYKLSSTFIGALTISALSPILSVADNAYAFILKKQGFNTGEPFRDPPEMINRSTLPRIFKTVVKVAETYVKIGGKRAKLFTYNGRFPSETIRLRRGDVLRLRLKNDLSKTAKKNIFGCKRHIINLHTHGWHVSPAGNSDNIFTRVGPGEDFLYEYDTSLQEPGTLSYYHTHYHHLVAEQIWRGLSGGVLIVEDEVEALKDFETHVMILRDISLSGTEPESYTVKDYIDGKEGNLNLVNGQLKPVLRMRPGQVQRWRIVNSNTARYYKISLEGMNFHLVGTDGGLLDRPYPLNSLLLTPGERADILIKAPDKEGMYRFISLPYNRRANRPEKLTLLIIECKGKPVGDKIPLSVNPDARRPDVDIKGLPRRTIRLIMPGNLPVGYINMKDFNKDPYVLTSKTGTYEVWDILNISPMDHPFHQHTNPAMVLDVQGEGSREVELYKNMPAWKDTINIPFGGSVRLLVPVKDFTGRAVFHCHILEHEVNGMMGIWEIT